MISLPHIAAAALLLVAMCASSAAQDLIVFGIRLGQRLDLPECEKEEPPSAANGFRYKERPEPKEPCYVSLSEIKIHDRVGIDFPRNEQPSITLGGSWFGINATVLDGKVEGIKFGTYGVKNASAVMEALTEKYGKPTDLTTSKAQNGYGATFDSIVALWALPDAANARLTVVFRSICVDTLDEGCVTIDTQKGATWRKEKLAEKSKDRRPL